MNQIRNSIAEVVEASTEASTAFETGSELSEMNDSLHLAIEKIDNQIEQFSV